MIFLEELNEVIDNFTDDEKRYIHNLTEEPTKLSKEDLYILTLITRTIDSDTTQAVKTLYIEMLEDVFLSDDGAYFKLTQNGADWSLKINKRPDDDWDSYILLARDASDDSALTDDAQSGETYADAESETIVFEDYAGTVDTFQKVRVLLESSAGEAVEQLLIIWVFVNDTIDSA